jgi:IS4 transposase
LSSNAFWVGLQSDGDRALISQEVLERFAQGSPLTVMAQLGLERALDAKWIDELFEKESQTQYTRELLFSTVVQVTSLVSMGLRPSVYAAAKSVELPVSFQALYDKLKGTETQVVRKLVSGSAARLTPLVQELTRKQAPMAAGYRLRIVDGNHLPCSEKRLKVLKKVRGAALPGQSLVVYDPDLDTAVDILPWEDAHSQERMLMNALLSSAQPGDLWIADRNFSTRTIVCGLIGRGAHFLIREHGASPNPTVVSKLKRIGRVETGILYEQSVSIIEEQNEQQVTHVLRRLELHLDEPSEDGVQVIRLLSNAEDSFEAKALAELYRRRWRIENLFQRLESVLNSEVRTLGAPRAALLAFGVALLAYNVLTLLKTAVRIQHADTLAKQQMEISPYYIAVEIRANHAGMLMAIPATVWQGYASMSVKELAILLLKLAANLDPKRFRSHPRKPKVKKKKGYVSKLAIASHVATARLLSKAKKRP